MTHPDRVDRLVILNLPHPKGLFRELAPGRPVHLVFKTQSCRRLA